MRVMKENDLYIAMCIVSAMEMESILHDHLDERSDLSWDTITLRCYSETLQEIARYTKAEA